jgi:hypothetical protein
MSDHVPCVLHDNAKLSVKYSRADTLDLSTVRRKDEASYRRRPFLELCMTLASHSMAYPNSAHPCIIRAAFRVPILTVAC